MAEVTIPKEHDSFQLVRSFSDEFRQSHPGDILGRGLNTALVAAQQREDNLAIQRDQWNFFLLEGRQLAIATVQEEEAVLMDQSRHLYKAWKRFCDNLPKDKGKEMTQQPPSLKALHSAVETASATWQDDRQGTKIGRLKGAFTRLCGTFQAHSDLVSMFPTDSKYTSLLTGSLTAIASACTNHQTLADGVAGSLEELGEDMLYWNMLIEQCPGDKNVRLFLIKLYTVVFEFLTEIFSQWSKSSWKRFITAFDQDAFQTMFADKRDRIKVIENRIERYIRVRQSAANKEFHDHMKSQVEKLGEALHSHLESQIQLLKPKTMLKDFSAWPDRIHLALEEAPSAIIAPGICMPAAHSLSRAPAPECPPPKQTTMLLDILKSLESIIAKSMQGIYELVEQNSQSTHVRISVDINRRLRNWITSLDDVGLWIEGPYGTPHPSQNTLLAASIVSTAKSQDIPCLFYFCSIQDRASTQGYLTPPELLIDMVRSLIAQLLTLASKKGGENASLDTPLDSFERLLQVDVDFESVIAVLHNLRTIVPGVLYCVIDAVQELEDRSDHRHTRNVGRFVRELANLNKPLGPGQATGSQGAAEQTGDRQLGRIVKVCYTSDGHVDFLAADADFGFMEKISYENESDYPGEDDGCRPDLSSWVKEN